MIELAFVWRKPSCRNDDNKEFLHLFLKSFCIKKVKRRTLYVKNFDQTKVFFLRSNEFLLARHKIICLGKSK